MSFEPNSPYNELPLLPPDKNKIETVEVYKKLAKARAALAELKGRAPVIPNQKMLINTLVLQEAKDSSSIENIFTTNDELYKAFSSPQPTMNRATKEVLKYREALWEAFQKIIGQNTITKELVINIYRQIKEAEDGFREKDVRIGNENRTVYTPPQHGKTLLEKIDNWFEFVDSANELDPLINMAVSHYQFESVHPFFDGNGRTGRIINVLYLVKENLLDLPILYLSQYINANKKKYYDLFIEVTKNSNWEAWILYMLDAVEITSNLTLDKINGIYNLFNETIKKVKAEAPDIYSYELVELLFHQPYCKISFLTESNIASRNTASKYLNKLSEIGILQKEKAGTESLFLNTQLYNLLRQ